MMKPVHLTETQIQFYKAEGYLTLPELISQAAATALRGEVLDLMSKIGLDISKLKQTNQYLERSGLDLLINSPHLRSIAEQLMEGPSTLYLPFTAVKSSQGGRFHFHQDNQYTRFDGPGINLWVALNEMTLENGCLRIVPRSHLLGTLDSVESGDNDSHRKIAWEPSDFLPLPMQPGDCVAFSRTTIHGSGPNRTPEPRIAYSIQFHRNDVHAFMHNEWKLLTAFPRWKTTPVREISALDENEMMDRH